mgnify:CR=1 FL=1
MDLGLKGKVVIITGSTEGIGRAAALARFLDYVQDHEKVWDYTNKKLMAFRSNTAAHTHTLHFQTSAAANAVTAAALGASLQARTTRCAASSDASAAKGFAFIRACHSSALRTRKSVFRPSSSRIALKSTQTGFKNLRLSIEKPSMTSEKTLMCRFRQKLLP